MKCVFHTLYPVQNRTLRFYKNSPSHRPSPMNFEVFDTVMFSCAPAGGQYCKSNTAAKIKMVDFMDFRAPEDSSADLPEASAYRSSATSCPDLPPPQR